MDNQSYYRIMDETGCDRAVTDQFLLVNCVGICSITRPFTTHRPQGRQDYYLMYLEQGTLEVLLNGQVLTMQPGHLVLFYPGEDTWYAKHDAGEMAYYWIHFTGSGVPSVLAGCGLEKPGIYFTGPGPDIPTAFRAVFQNYINRDSCHAIAAAAQLISILVLIRRSMADLANTRRDLTAGKMKASLAYIHHHYSQPITIRELADLEHLSTSRYCALFQRATGISPNAYIIDLRLRMATDLMMKTDLSLKQIAQLVGYDDQLYFSRLFHSKRGLSPKQYVVSLSRLLP